MPTSASAAMTAFAVLRTTQSVLATEARSMGGWLIWTAMKISPATAALMPAARVRLVVVMVTTDSWVAAGRAGCPAMSRTVGIDMVTPHHQVM